MQYNVSKYTKERCLSNFFTAYHISFSVYELWLGGHGRKGFEWNYGKKHALRMWRQIRYLGNEN